MSAITRLFAAVLLPGILIAGAGAPPRAAVAHEQVAARPVAIPFESGTRLIIVKASVKGSRPLSFIVDTGATRALVRLDVAKQLGLDLYGNVNLGGAGPARQSGSMVRNAAWSLAGLEGFSQPVTLAVPLSELPAAIGRDVDGIIGGEFIRQFVVELDYEARTMTLHDRAAFEYRGSGQSLPLDFNADGHPVVTATVTPRGKPPVERRFVLDTGSGGALVLHSPFVAEQQLPGTDVRTVRAIGAAGAGGRAAGQLGRVAALQIGSVAFENVTTMFSEDKAGAFANAALAGNIGSQILNRFRLFLDYGRRRIILEPTARAGEPFDRALAGVALRARGADYRTFVVHEVLESSPATDAGLAVGDVIVSIDGTPAESLTLWAINEMFAKVAAYELTIRRGDRTMKTTLTPAKLI